MLAAATRYAAHGLAVFPCWNVKPLDDGLICGCGKFKCPNAGKHPLGHLAPRGLIDATTDLNLVERWWRAVPDANVAIALDDRHVVLDVDPRHGGDETLAQLEDKHGRLPETWRARTGGDGSHIWFAGTGFKCGTLAPGLDIKTHGGYVIAPPSRHISGKRYAWISAKTDLAPTPAWLAAAVHRSPAPTSTSTRDWRSLICNGVNEGGRNTAVTRVAGMLLHKRIDPIVTLELLLGWNTRHCRPPLRDDEITQIVDSIAACELRRRSVA
jgi:hypothetical protein